MAWKTSRSKMSNSDRTALAHDFEVLLRYVVEQRVVLTPKQKCIPARHIRNMMADFQVKTEKRTVPKPAGAGLKADTQDRCETQTQKEVEPSPVMLYYLQRIL